MSKYNIIYADPPWSYNDKMKMKGVHGMIRGAESFYKTMGLNSIKTLAINSISAENSYLFLWVTMPLLQEGLEVIEAWGFKYKTCGFSWIKTTKNNKLHCGLGHYTRGNTELCLLGVKGKVKVINKSIRQIVMAEIGKHSQKPAIVRDKIVELCGDLPRIELFAREKVKGWDSWGDEVVSDIDIMEV